MSNRHKLLSVKLKMIRDRIEKRGDRKCDLCRVSEGVEWHHIVTRHSTMANEVAREVSNSPYLGALLCSECHRVADSEKNRNALFQELYRIYGYADVAAAYYVVKLHMKFGLLFYPPNPEKKDE